ncbi:MAG: DUF2752 domain-containing protein [Actinomycetota bacterium]|nr:DUF2752 domain-containing protein [Actinomycetota bacterium]
MLRSRTIVLDPADLRYAAASVVVAGAALPLLPVHAPIACPLRTTTGVPCPLCGMTTSVAATLRLDFGAALAATPAGIAAIVLGLAVLTLRPRAVRLPAVLLFAALGAMWLYQLHRFAFL